MYIGRNLADLWLEEWLFSLEDYNSNLQKIARAAFFEHKVIIKKQGKSVREEYTYMTRRQNVFWWSPVIRFGKQSEERDRIE